MHKNQNKVKCANTWFATKFRMGVPRARVELLRVALSLHSGRRQKRRPERASRALRIPHAENIFHLFNRVHSGNVFFVIHAFHVESVRYQKVVLVAFDVAIFAQVFVVHRRHRFFGFRLNVVA